MNVADDLAKRIADGDVIVIDGGMATELQAQGVPMHDETWSAVANLERPDLVRAVHEDYIRSGADVIIVNTYTASRAELERAGLGDRVEEANRNAVRAAVEARERAADRPVVIAGSLSSTPARDVMQRGRPGLSGQELLDCYREQATAQAEAGVDLMALEMMTAPEHGAAALQAATETGLPVWLGTSVRPPEDGHIRTIGVLGGHELDEILDKLLGPSVTVVNIMHSVFEAVEPAVAEIRRRWEGPVGAYPHAGTFTPPDWIFADITPSEYAAAARGWIGSGVQLIGGCCGIRPSHIRAVKEMLPAR